MWHHVIVTALHLALRNRADARANASANVNTAAETTPARRVPSVGAFVPLAIVAGCCLGCMGLFAAFGALLSVTGEIPQSPDDDPADALVASLLVCFAPSLLFLVPAFLSLRRTRRLGAIVNLGSERQVDATTVAHALGVSEADAGALLEQAYAEGYLPRRRAASDARGETRDVASTSPVVRAQDVLTGASTGVDTIARTCPFCRAVVTIASTETKPRCTACGVPFSTRSLS